MGREVRLTLSRRGLHSERLLDSARVSEPSISSRFSTLLTNQPIVSDFFGYLK